MREEASDVRGEGPGRTAGPCAVAVLDVGGTKIAGALAVYGCGDGAFDGREGSRGKPRVVGRRRVPTDAARGGDAVLGSVVEMVGGLLGDAPACAGGLPVVGVGVSTAGNVCEADGSIASANGLMPGWTGRPVGEAVGRAWGLPVAVMNDVSAYALGELRHGAAAGCRSCIVAAVGTGLGGALVVDGRVLDGARGLAGQFGRALHPAAVGVPSAFGPQGFLEAVASGSGIETCYRLGGGGDLSGAEISRRAEGGEELALRVVRQAGSSLGEALASLADMLDPDLVVVSGSVCDSGEVWGRAFDEAFKARLAPELAGLRVVKAALGSDAPLVGAAERLLDKIGFRG